MGNYISQYVGYSKQISENQHFTYSNTNGNIHVTDINRSKFIYHTIGKVVVRDRVLKNVSQPKTVASKRCFLITERQL